MKTWILLFIGTYFMVGQLADIRKFYPDAAVSKANAEAFYALLEKVDDNDANPVLQAYKGCSETLKSKFSSNIPEKMKFMKAGAKRIDAAVAADPNNVEIRMVRLSVQERVPTIVNYRSNLKEDHDFILENYAKDAALKEYIKNFMLGSKTFSKAEKNSLK